MPDLAWYRWFPGHYRASTRVDQLTLEEEGAYRRLLDAMFLAGGFLRDDSKSIAKSLGVTPSKWQRLRRKLVDEVKVVTVDERGLWNEKLLAEYANSRAFVDGRSRAGKAGAEKRWHSDASANASGMAAPLAEPLPKQCFDDGQEQEQVQVQDLGLDRSAERDPDLGIVSASPAKTAAAAAATTSLKLPKPRSKPERKREVPDSAHHRVVAHWFEKWKAQRGAEYVPSDADFAGLKRVLGKLGEAEVLARMDRAFADPWFTEQAGDLKLFGSMVNRFAVPLPGAGNGAQTSARGARPHNADQLAAIAREQLAREREERDQRERLAKPEGPR